MKRKKKTAEDGTAFEVAPADPERQRLARDLAIVILRRRSGRQRDATGGDGLAATNDRKSGEATREHSEV